jgi:dTDP-6-deoxy-L-talose 4-dehydrogenase (NAD+)
MKIFLTGGTGFIGSHFIEAALQEGHSITALRRNNHNKHNYQDNVKWVDSTLDSINNEHLKNHDVLVHLAAFSANTPYEELSECIYWNVYAPIKLFKDAYDVGIDHFVVAGSCFEYGLSKNGIYGIDSSLNPIMSYPTSKACSSIAFQGFTREKDVSLSYLRIFQAYGDGEKESRFWPSLKKAALDGRDFEMSDGNQVRDFVHVDQIVKKLLDEVQVQNKPKKGIPKLSHIASGNPSSLKDFAKNQWKRFNASGELIFGKIRLKRGEQNRIISREEDII